MKLDPKELGSRAASPFADHRAYVGGMWDEIGQLQFDFLVARGLRPEHVLVDIGCGSLRGGRHFIRYLDPGNYLGLDHLRELIDAGLRHEVPQALIQQKRPEFVVSNSFEFDRFSRKPTHALAQSLFTHLATEDIELCLRQLRSVVDRSVPLFATYFSPDDLPETLPDTWPPDVRHGTYRNPIESNYSDPFLYSTDTFAELAGRCGWQWRNLGRWNHPRGQLIGMFVAQ